VPARSSSSQWRSDISEMTAWVRAVVSMALDRRHRSDSRACGPRGRNRRFMPLRAETGGRSMRRRCRHRPRSRGPNVAAGQKIREEIRGVGFVGQPSDPLGRPILYPCFLWVDPTT
jgi:hypothetical protein